MKKKIQVNVAVTGLNAHDNPGPGIPVARSLRDSKDFDMRVIGFAYENLEPGIYMHHVIDKTYQVPYPSAGQENLLKRLEYIQSVENIKVLIPNYDAELYNYMKLADTLKDMGICTFLPTLDQFDERHKSNLPAYGKKYDLKIPYSRAIMSLAEVHSLTRDFTYPLVVKGKFYDAYIAHSPEQVHTYFSKLSSKWGLPIIIQQFIKGTEVNVAALGDGEGNTIGAVPMKKQYITDKGKAWAGITLDDQSMIDLTHKIIGATKWKGGMELELIKDSKGDLYIVEINPRIPAWIYLTVGAGQNLPEALVKLALGMKVKPFKKHKSGILFVRYSWDLITDVKEFEKISTFGEL